MATLSAHRPRGAPHANRGAWKDKVSLAHFDEADAEIAREFGLDG